MLIPKPSDRYRPRADAALLSRLVTDAWQDYQSHMFNAAERDRVAEIVAAHLESLYPAADMAVLSRYGVAQTLNSIGVRMWNPAQRLWDQTTSVSLPRPIIAPGSESGLYVGGAWHSRSPNSMIVLAALGRPRMGSVGSTRKGSCASESDVSAFFGKYDGRTRMAYQPIAITAAIVSATRNLF